jgi:hypothetical protein
MTQFTFDEHAVSDLHKDAYGFRPSPEFSILWQCSSDEQKQEIWDDLIATLRREMAAEEEKERIAIGDFERGIQMNLAMGAEDRATAILWMLDGTLEDWGLAYGGEHACYVFGLPFSMQTELDPVVEQLRIKRGL